MVIAAQATDSDVPLAEVAILLVGPAAQMAELAAPKVEVAAPKVEVAAQKVELAAQMEGLDYLMVESGDVLLQRYGLQPG